MGKISKILVCGHSGVGKTAAIEQLIYGNHVAGMPMHSTIEDIYTAMIETDRGLKEKVRIFDTGGLDGAKTDLPRHYLTFPDGFVLVYDVTNWDSFQKLEKLKKDIDKNREKREIHIIAIGNKSEEQESRQVDFNTAQMWANREKVRLWEASVKSRQSLIEPFVWLTSRITQPQSKSTFLPGRKAKAGEL
ncbi:NF-kappa-B inhibitor-interacting Ras-like protein 1 [Ylistrum balloti]|uniref:NF-kappa-B inhibitor-interacting Ras-like protein 1 n=1 Tax=Ylistrum balloti TaxID=509963 RepID=UPI0029058D66|nr:NF-kappa-B inhibitor-interacting Ras-like protein 1 [Ylistrum balloti]XP_060081329.1 NF-kappa-B inhibitor-interacting Ras-like protein 1 [Ylistrum balloti]